MGINRADLGSLPQAPYFPEIGVLALVANRWGDPWQSRQQILTRLARFFNIVWVDPPRGWRELWLNAPHQVGEFDPAETDITNFRVYRPGRWLPQLYRPRFLALLAERQRFRRAQRMLQKQGCRKTILYLWRPEYAPALDLLSYDLSCYHIVDEYTFSEVEKPIGETEASLISRVDQVLIHSPALLEKKGKLNPNTVFVPNGVDYPAYAAPLDEPEDMRSIPHPRIGYSGMIKKQLDWPLILRLTSKHPEWSFVFVGERLAHPEVTAPIEQLSRRPNVYFLGAKSVKECPAYPQHFDVCMMPYRMNDYTKFIYPLKLHEYLASGRPVVGSPIRTLQDFGGVIALARTEEEWSRALRASLDPSARSASRLEARRRVARQYDWDNVVRRIAGTMCERLGPAYLERFNHLPIKSV